MVALVVSGCSVLGAGANSVVGAHGTIQIGAKVVLANSDLALPPAAERMIANAVQDGLAYPGSSAAVAWQAGGHRGNVRVGVPFSVNDMQCRDVQIIVMSAAGQRATGDTMCQTPAGIWGSVMLPPFEVSENN